MTYAVVASFVELSDVAGVMPLTVPVKTALDKPAFPLNVVAKSVPFSVIAGVDTDFPAPTTMFPANDWSVVAVFDA